MTEPLDLDAIEKRAEAASPWPWRSDDLRHRNGGRFGIRAAGSLAGIATVLADGRHPAEDAAFIVAAREDVPALVAEVRRLLEALDQAGRRESELLDMLEAAARKRKGPAA